MRASTGMHKTKRLAIFILTTLALAACGGVRLDPLKLKITDMDRRAAEFPPSAEELAAPFETLLPLAIKGEELTPLRFNRILKFILVRFEKYGGLEIVPDEFIESALSNKKDREFYFADISEAIELGKALKASFTVQIYVNITENDARSGGFKAAIRMVAFKTDDGRALFNREILFDSRNSQKAASGLKSLIESRFPVRAFILETRGERRAARISAGRSSGIVLGRKFQTRGREGENRTGESLSPATLEVIKVMENDSWAQIKKRDRDKVIKGQAVFSPPEK